MVADSTTADAAITAYVADTVAASTDAMSVEDITETDADTAADLSKAKASGSWLNWKSAVVLSGSALAVYAAAKWMGSGSTAVQTIRFPT